MRTIIQRVSNGSVSVEGKVVGSIENGLVCLIGIAVNDRPEHIDYL
jgi:D-tyrosyl-tRNA(Tyr) deacylase